MEPRMFRILQHHQHQQFWGGLACHCFWWKQENLLDQHILPRLLDQLAYFSLCNWTLVPKGNQVAVKLFESQMSCVHKVPELNVQIEVSPGPFYTKYSHIGSQLPSSALQVIGMQDKVGNILKLYAASWSCLGKHLVQLVVSLKQWNATLKPISFVTIK